MPTKAPPFYPDKARYLDDNLELHQIKNLTNRLQRAVIGGNAWRVSVRTALDDDDEFTVHIEPNEVSGTLHLEAPAINPDAEANFDVFHDAEPQETVDDLVIHNQRYDVPHDAIEATVVRVPDGQLSGGTKTEETRISPDKILPVTGGEDARGIWRTVPVGDVISIRITDRSGGTDNMLGFVTTLYEGDIFPD